MTTQARTKRSKVMPVVGPPPIVPVEGAGVVPGADDDEEEETTEDG